MLNKTNRASQFLPFDSLKGLQEELRRREFNNSQEEKKDLSDERSALISNTLLKLNKDTFCEIEYYSYKHYVTKKGHITKINVPYKFLFLNDIKIPFDDIYNINILN